MNFSVLACRPNTSPTRWFDENHTIDGVYRWSGAPNLNRWHGERSTTAPPADNLTMWTIFVAFCPNKCLFMTWHISTKITRSFNDFYLLLSLLRFGYQSLNAGRIGLHVSVYTFSFILWVESVESWDNGLHNLRLSHAKNTLPLVTLKEKKLLNNFCGFKIGTSSFKKSHLYRIYHIFFNSSNLCWWKQLQLCNLEKKCGKIGLVTVNKYAYGVLVETKIFTDIWNGLFRLQFFLVHIVLCRKFL